MPLGSPFWENMPAIKGPSLTDCVARSSLMGKVRVDRGNGSPKATEQNLLGIPVLTHGSVIAIYKWTLAPPSELTNWEKSVTPASPSVESSKILPCYVTVRVTGSYRGKSTLPAHPVAGAGSRGAPRPAQPNLQEMLGSEPKPSLWKGHSGPRYRLYFRRGEKPVASDPCPPSPFPFLGEEMQLLCDSREVPWPLSALHPHL